MANYNAMPGPSTGASANESLVMDFGSGQFPNSSMGVFDPDLAFDESVLDGSTLQNFTFPTPYDQDASSSNYVDPFPVSSHHFEVPSHQDAQHEESSSKVLDEKLLCFQPPIPSATLIDETGQFSDALMTAELYGMFFVAEDVFSGETTGRPLELTCYRRNLWQCTGLITLPRVITHVVNDRGTHIPIYGLVATITATESNEGKSAEIISIPWKNANAQPGDENKTVGPPSPITLDLASGQEIDGQRVVLTISWKRLQFKHATANNGRRKGLQQHFNVKIALHGRGQEDLIKIAEIQSSPVIVRGRSPRNFDSRKDVPITSDRRLERRNTTSAETSSFQLEREASQGFPQVFPSITNMQQHDWSSPQPTSHLNPTPQPGASPHPAKRMALSPNMTNIANIPKPPVPSWIDAGGTGKPSAPSAMQPLPRQSNSLPINLSLSEDERSPNRSSSDLHSPRGGKATAMAGHQSENSPPEEVDPLYEYFPLPVDVWAPPVDAVYRPHVVHHTIVPTEMKDQQLKNKAKRYFAAD